MSSLRRVVLACVDNEGHITSSVQFKVRWNKAAVPQLETLLGVDAEKEIHDFFVREAMKDFPRVAKELFAKEAKCSSASTTSP